MDSKIQRIIDLIKKSELDQTIKDILVRDLQTEGLTDFMKEQIKAYCLGEIKKVDKEIADIEQMLGKSQNPAA